MFYVDNANECDKFNLETSNSMSLRVMLSMVLLQYLATSYVSSEDCPHPDDMYPCTCVHTGANSDIDVTCKGISVQEVERAFVHLRGKYVQEVVLRELTGSRLSSFAFWSTRIKNIEIHDSRIAGLADSDERPAFVGLETSLEKLMIKRTVWGNYRLRKLDLAHLKHLKELRLHNNSIPEIGNDWFVNGPINLTLLEIIHCGVKKLGDRAFASLVNLQSLRLPDNPFKVVQRTMVANPALKLKGLHFWNDSLSSLPDDIFSGMPALTTVHVERNLFRRLQPKVWTSVWSQVSFLFLNDNPLECDSHVNWTFRVKPPAFLEGTCHLPQKLNGTSLARLIHTNKKSQLPPAT